MKLAILNGLCGEGKCVSRSGLIGGFCAARRVGSNVAITGSIVLLLVGTCVRDCGGKPFHVQGGQAEVEEDTTQGSLKEKFSPAGALVISSASAGGGPHSVLDDDEQEDNEEDSGVIGMLPFGTQDEASQRWSDEGTFSNNYKPVHHSTHTSNYGAAVHKRSLGGRYSLDDGGGDEEFQRLQRFTSHNNRPMYFEQSGVSTVGSELPSGSAAGNNMRQKIMNLRNQYGDKWFAYVGPYAYRKRQILYRQCFFNPISCF